MGKRGKTERYDRAVEREVHDLGAVQLRASQMFINLEDEDFYVKSITFQSPFHTGGDWRVIVRVHAGGEDLVGFHGAHTYAEAGRGALERIDNRTMKWKEDEYAK